jgi:predicted ester cyclase
MLMAQGAAGDRVTSILVFRGHRMGTFNGHAGQGVPVDFMATDIQRQAGELRIRWSPLALT